MNNEQIAKHLENKGFEVSLSANKVNVMFEQMEKYDNRWSVEVSNSKKGGFRVSKTIGGLKIPAKMVATVTEALKDL
jgi:hypothetical protein